MDTRCIHFVLSIYIYRYIRSIYTYVYQYVRMLSNICTCYIHKQCNFRLSIVALDSSRVVILGTNDGPLWHSFLKRLKSLLQSNASWTRVVNGSCTMTLQIPLSVEKSTKPFSNKGSTSSNLQNAQGLLAMTLVTTRLLSDCTLYVLYHFPHLYISFLWNVLHHYRTTSVAQYHHSVIPHACTGGDCVCRNGFGDFISPALRSHVWHWMHLGALKYTLSSIKTQSKTCDIKIYSYIYTYSRVYSVLLVTGRNTKQE